MSASIAFVTHAGPGIGLGHLRRCLALAAAWAREGAEIALLADGGEAAAERAAPALAAAGASRVDVAAIPWTRRPGAARERLRALGAGVVVVDSYLASPAFLASLAAVAGRVVAVDDLADRPLPVHVVVNGGIGAEHPYDRGADTRFLLGPRYALIDPRFAEGPARDPARPVCSALIALGGAPPPAALRQVLAAVAAALPGAAVAVVAGPFGPLELGGLSGGAIAVHRDPPDMRALMLAADLAVVGAGVTLNELAATGTPAVIVEMADNQAPNAAGFARAGAAVLAGRAGQPDLGARVAAAIGRLAGSPSLRASVVARARELVDGRGALRAAREIAAPAPAAGEMAR